MHLTIPTREGIPDGLIPNPLTVDRVLYEAESPILFLTKTVQNQLLLAYLAEDNSNGTFTILTPTVASTIASLENGSMAVRDAIESCPPWLHWTMGGRSKTWALDSADIPSGFLPQPGAMLSPELEPILRTRAIGPSLVLGRMPASVVAFVADSTRKAMKTLLDFTLEATPGRPKDEHRTLYDLPIQSFAFASFELSFGLPAEELFTREQVRNAAQKLDKGLVWAANTTGIDLVAETDSEREAILRAVLLLTPPASGIISQVEMSGTLLSKGKVTLNKDSRRRIRQALRQVDSERIFKIEGRLGEIDTDRLTFILRDTSDEQDRSGSFSEEILEEMIALLTERVTVVGLERQGKLNVAAVVPAAKELADSESAPPV